MFTLVVFTLVVGATTSKAFSSAATTPSSSAAGSTCGRSRRPPTRSATCGGDRRLAHASRVRLSRRRRAVVPAGRGEAGRRGRLRRLPGPRPRRLRTSRTPASGSRRPHAAISSARAVWRALRERSWSRGRRPVRRAAPQQLELRRVARLPAHVASTSRIAHFDPVGVTVRDPQTGVTKRAHRRRRAQGHRQLRHGRHPHVATGARSLRRPGAAGDLLLQACARRERDDRRQEARSQRSSTTASRPTRSSKLLDDVMDQSRTFQQIVLGFLGLGLVVGVAALGVISARAVVERRQHIGVLRAIGFRRGMVQGSFVLEASFLALTSIALGNCAGAGGRVQRDHRRRAHASWAGVSFDVPWTMLGGDLRRGVRRGHRDRAGTRARRAARIEPASALRYQ